MRLPVRRSFRRIQELQPLSPVPGFVEDIIVRPSGNSIPLGTSSGDSFEWPSSWTPDSKTLIFHSDREGRERIYMQALDGGAPELVADQKSYYGGGGKVSADGNWILYLQGHEGDDPQKPSAPPQLMRLPLHGTSAQVVFSLQHRDAYLQCARRSSNMCVIVERTEDRKQVVITAVDPLKGRGPELIRIASTMETRCGHPSVGTPSVCHGRGRASPGWRPRVVRRPWT